MNKKQFIPLPDFLQENPDLGLAALILLSAFFAIVFWRPIAKVLYTLFVLFVPMILLFVVTLPSSLGIWSLVSGEWALYITIPLVIAGGIISCLLGRVLFQWWFDFVDQDEDPY
ncbi:MAG: hypothetical protein LBS05_02520 [Tannerellaceae bacterium]|jgi:hypothetical protein|nr:hypothetical protein [Tannerellaceae bacterium]